MSRFLQKIVLCFFLISSGSSLLLHAQQISISSSDDSTRFFTLRTILIEGNKVTKDKIILRELPVKAGDRIAVVEKDTLAVRCKQQLANLSLFNSVRVSFTPDSSGNILLHIIVVERWYTWPLPIFQIADRNFNQWWLTKDPERLNYGIEFTQYNMRGRNETMRIKLQDGFTRKFEVAYTLPWVGKSQTVGASFKTSYLQNREIWYATKNNKLLYYRDASKPMLERYTAMFTLKFRKHLYKTSLLNLAYNDIQIGDTVVENTLNHDYLLDGRKAQRAFSLSYTYVNDRRDYKYYPLNGHLTVFEIGHTGLGVSKDVNIGYLSIIRNEYIKLAAKHYLSIGLKTKVSIPQRQPYNFYRALGYADYVRGYEYYVIDGRHFALLKLNYNYCLFTKEGYYDFIPFYRIRHIPFSVYANVFNDWGYTVNDAYKASNSYSNSALYSVGAGLDFVAFYDKVFRMEIALNKQGRAGLYLHLQYPL